MSGEESNTIRQLLKQHGKTYAQEAGIRLKNQPAPLFQLLNLALLLSARIPAQNATEAAAALKRAGLTTPRKMTEASWQDRVDVLTAHGYKRYDESAARMLGDSAQLLLDKYSGDLRKLREAARHRVDDERQRLEQFKGIGEVGADIFLREVQGLWPEVHPFADRRVLESAGRLKLPKSPKKLSQSVAKKDFPRLAAALIRSSLDKKKQS